MPAYKDLIVIGASAGGVEALLHLAASFPADWPVSVMIVLHLSAEHPSLLATLLNRAGPLRASEAVDGETLRRGRLYVARPDWHLLVEKERLRLEHFAKENGHRPAIDVLFRSAARTYGSGAIGVLLSGADDDGTGGLLMIKEFGGTTVVQDPRDAAFPAMPQSALDKVHPDHVVRLADLPALLVRLSAERSKESPVKKHKKNSDAEPGAPTGLTCPECGGALWEEHFKELPHFRCHVGHRFSAAGLAHEQGAFVESALWTAHRALKERAAFARNLAVRARQKDISVLRTDYERRAREAQTQADIIERLLLHPKNSAAAPKRRETSHPSVRRLQKTIRAGGPSA